MVLQTSADCELGSEQQTEPSSLLRTIIFTFDLPVPQGHCQGHGKSKSGKEVLRSNVSGTSLIDSLL